MLVKDNMSFNNPSYDAGAYQQDLNQSTGQGRYQLLPPSGQHPEKCFQPRGSGQSHDQAYIADIVEYQNEILGLTRRYSKDPMEQYPFKQADVTHYSAMECASGMGQEQEHSRLDFFREQNRLDLSLERNDNRGLCLNLQDTSRIPSNTRNGMNTRLFFRDNFKPTPKQPRSQDAFVPTGTSARQPDQKISGNCKCD